MSIIRKLKNIARQRKFAIYTKPFELNIWGVRSKNVLPNRFDDVLHVFFVSDKDKRLLKKWMHYAFPITTDPGTYWLNHPMHPQGTAMLASGQYIDTYQIDLHRNKYYALCQRKGKVNVYRDYNRNTILDFGQGTPESGMFGINIHRARRTGTTYTVDSHSAGCQVFQKVSDFDFFMKLCEMHRAIHGNLFSYTLIDHRIELKNLLRKTTIGLLSAGALASGVYLWMNKHYLQPN